MVELTIGGCCKPSQRPPPKVAWESRGSTDVPNGRSVALSGFARYREGPCWRAAECDDGIRR